MSDLTRNNPEFAAGTLFEGPILAIWPGQKERSGVCSPQMREEVVMRGLHAETGLRSMAGGAMGLYTALSLSANSNP